MHKKLAFAGLGLALLASPLFASAATECLQLTRTLSRGSRGADVSSLQTFLVSQNLLAGGNVTGYFGPLTQAAVQQFQCTENIVCTGSPTETGWGVVGPRTRASIQSVSCKGDQPPPNPPPAATISCTLSADNPIIYAGESATLSWTSQNAAGGTINPTVGAVSPSGSHSVSPAQSTSYVGVFSGANNATAQCQTTVTVLPNTQTSCTWNGQTIQNGQSVTAYQSSAVDFGMQCVSQQRTCTNGTLSGSYAYASCTVSGGTVTSCTWNGQTIANGSSLIAYQASTVPAGSQCVSETRTCRNGTLSGTNQYASCTVAAGGGGGGGTTSTTCTATANTAIPTSGPAPLAVTFNQLYSTNYPWDGLDFGDGTVFPFSQLGPYQLVVWPGGIGEPSGTYCVTHTYTFPGTYTEGPSYQGHKGKPYPFANPVITVTGSTASTVGTCVYKGTTYANGQTIGIKEDTVPPLHDNYTVVLTCDNGWAVAAWRAKDACDYLGRFLPSTLADIGCNFAAGNGSPACTPASTIGAQPSSGPAPLTVTFTLAEPTLYEAGFNFGDMTAGGIFNSHPNGSLYSCVNHTYTSAGTYSANFAPNIGSKLTVTVTGATADAERNSNLASVLAALESALQAIQKLLGQ